MSPRLLIPPYVFHILFLLFVFLIHFHCCLVHVEKYGSIFNLWYVEAIFSGSIYEILILLVKVFGSIFKDEVALYTCRHFYIFQFFPLTPRSFFSSLTLAWSFFVNHSTFVVEPQVRDCVSTCLAFFPRNFIGVLDVSCFKVNFSIVFTYSVRHDIMILLETTLIPFNNSGNMTIFTMFIFHTQIQGISLHFVISSSIF